MRDTQVISRAFWTIERLGSLLQLSSLDRPMTSSLHKNPATLCKHLTVRAHVNPLTTRRMTTPECKSEGQDQVSKQRG
jgi:hypothetical protein